MSCFDADPECLDALHRLYHFLDGELTPETRQAIDDHLNACRPCLEAFGFEAELRRLIAAKCREDVPEGLRDRIAGAIDHELAEGSKGS